MRSLLVALAGTCACLLLLVSGAQAQDTLYVAPAASGDCTAWGDACGLQDALGEATGSDEIWIAEGTYTPGSRSEDSFTITGAQDGLTIYGGFAGDETSLDERDRSDHETILSANIGTPDIEDNSYHVLFIDGTVGSGPSSGRVTPATVLDGLTVTGADADGFGSDGGFGGGMYCDGAGGGNECSPTLRNVAFVDNKAFRGGAIYHDGGGGGESSPRITNATFIGNRADNGGAVYNDGRAGRSSPQMTNATFIDNRASNPNAPASAEGGAIYSNGFDGGTSSPQIVNTIFWGNAASGDGDALAGVDDSPSITYSLVEGRTPSGTGNLDGTDASNAPSFVNDNPADGPYDLRLFGASTAIDAGTNAPFAPGGVAEGVTTDLRGDARIQDGDGDGTATVTLGAHEPAIDDFVDLRLAAAPTAVAGPGPDVLTFRLANQGNIGTAGASVTLDVPSGVTLTKTGGPGTLSGGVWAVGTVAAATEVTLTVEVGRTGDPVGPSARTATLQDGYVPVGASDITTPDDETAPWAVLPAPYGAGRALAPQDTGEYVSADAASDSLAGPGALTVEAWVYPENGADRPAVLAFNGTSEDNKNILFYDAGRFQYYDPDIQFQSSTDTYPEGQWHHVAIVIAADDSGTLYVNGTEQGTFTTGVRPVAGGRFSIGQEWDNDTASNLFVGRLDEVRLWDTARTRDDIREGMHRTGDPSASRLAAYWRFEAGTAETVYDYAGRTSGTLGDPRRRASGAPVGQQAALASGGQTRAVGPSGGAVQVENTSATGADTLAIYQYGTATGALIDGTTEGEDFSGVSPDRRLNVVWGIEPAAGAGGTADVTFDFGGLTGVDDPGQVRLLRRVRPGTAWQDVTADWTLDAAAETFRRSGLSSFSEYAVAGTAQALPVELAGLEATATTGGVTLTWRTASETGNAGFRVQRRGEGGTGGRGDWVEVGSVDGAGTTTEVRSYAFTDEGVPYTADSLTYRLKQVDTDGTANYSEAVTVSRGAARELRLLGPYPNPAQSRATVRFAIPEGASRDVALHLYDVLGRQVQTVRVEATAGRHERQLDTRGLAGGVYFLRLRAGGVTRTQKLTVVQ